VVGLDVARCVALLGMIVTHVLPAADENGVTVAQQVAGGRASALFAVLAGVSLALMSGGTAPVRGPERRAVSAGLAVRAALIALLGLLLGSLPVAILVILCYYGVLFLLGLPFLGLRARALAVVAAAWLVVVPVLSHLVRPYLPAAPVANLSLASPAQPWRLVTELTFTGTYPAVPWLAYLLVGMAIGRSDLRRRRTAAVLVVAGAALALVSWETSRVLLRQPGVMDRLEQSFTGTGRLADTLEHGMFGSTPTGTWWWLAVETPHTATPFDLAHTIGCAMAVIGLALLLGRALPVLAAVLFGAGAMTLSLYTAHVVLRTPELLPEDDVPTFAAHVLIVLTIGAAYRLARRSGPLERLVTTSANGTRDAVRRRLTTSASGS
jgi:uncharacterized membrane protein